MRLGFVSMRILKVADVRQKTKVVIGNHDVCGLKGFVRPMDKKLLKTFDIEPLEAVDDEHWISA